MSFYHSDPARENARKTRSWKTTETNSKQENATGAECLRSIATSHLQAFVSGSSLVGFLIPPDVIESDCGMFQGPQGQAQSVVKACKHTRKHCKIPDALCGVQGYLFQKGLLAVRLGLGREGVTSDPETQPGIILTKWPSWRRKSSCLLPATLQIAGNQSA